jgi:NAD(P)-dependent dehydrogenase (short-subunit alcohol dehydrogenase family)
MMAVNVVGAFLCAGAAVRRMSTRHGGSGGAIVNVSSAAARLGSAGEYVDYAASKGALDTMTIGLAKEVAAEGVRVNTVRPGVIDTEIHASGGQPDRAAKVGSMAPVGRAGTAAEVAAAILWLCLPETSSYVVGAFLDVTGGR